MFQLRCTNLLAQPVAGWLMYAAGGIICTTTLLTSPSYSIRFPVLPRCCSLLKVQRAPEQACSNFTSLRVASSAPSVQGSQHTCKASKASQYCCWVLKVQGQHTGCAPPILLLLWAVAEGHSGSWGSSGAPAASSRTAPCGPQSACGRHTQCGQTVPASNPPHQRTPCLGADVHSIQPALCSQPVFQTLTLSCMQQYTSTSWSGSML